MTPTYFCEIENLFKDAEISTSVMVVGVGFCKIKVDSNFLLVLKIKCTKFHQDRSKTVDLHTKYTNKQTFSFIYIYRFL
jgi:hypothetical protein